MKTELKFNPLFYSKEILNKAVEDFKNIAKITINNNIIEFECDEEIVPYEFCNYLLKLKQ